MMMSLSPHIPEEARSWRNHPAIWKWCRQNAPISVAQHSEWLYEISHDASIKMFGINADHQYIGVCGLTSINRLNQTAEFSLYIATEFQKKGYGKKALSLLFDHGFKNENLNRIWGEVFEGNPAMKMFKNLGMIEEGTLRESYYRDGKFIDSTIVSLLRDEWRKLGCS